MTPFDFRLIRAIVLAACLALTIWAPGARGAALAWPRMEDGEPADLIAADDGIEALVLIDSSPAVGSLSAEQVFRVATRLYESLPPGSRVSLFAATRSPTELVVITKRDRDVAQAILSLVWREKVHPLAERSVDPAGALVRLVEEQERRPDVLVVLLTRSLTNSEASTAWRAAKTVRDRSGALVVFAGPNDPALQRGAATGVFTSEEMQAARPEAWVEEVNRRKHPTVAVTADLDRHRAEVRDLLAAVQRLEGERDQARSEGTKVAGERDRASEEARQAAERERAATERERLALAQADDARAEAADARRSREALAAQVGAFSKAHEEQGNVLDGAQKALEQERAARTTAVQQEAAARGELSVVTAQVEDLRARLSVAQIELEDALRLDRKADQPEGAAPMTARSDEIAPIQPEPTANATEATNRDGEATTGVPGRGSLLVLSSAGGLILVLAGAWSLSRGRRRSCRIAGVWGLGLEARSPLDVIIELRSQVLAIPADGEPHASAIEEIGTEAHLVTRGGMVEVCDDRPDAEILINNERIPDSRARAGIGDKVTVRHPGGKITTFVIRDIQRVNHRSHKSSTNSVTSSVAAMG